MLSRSSVFSFIIALSLGPRLIATIVASRLIELYGPWLPLWFSLGFLVATCLLSFFIIEPKKKIKHLDDSVSDDANAYSSSEQPTAAAGSRQLKDKILRSFQEARAGASFLMQKSSSFTIRIIVCLIFMTLAWQCSGVSEQLMRRRFGWSWAKVCMPVSNRSFLVTTWLSILILLVAILRQRLADYRRHHLLHDSFAHCVLHYVQQVHHECNGARPVCGACLRRCVYLWSHYYNVDAQWFWHAYW